MVHQLLDLLHVSLGTCCLRALKPSSWALPQLRQGLLKKRSGLYFSLPWRPRRPSLPSPLPVPSSWPMGTVVAKLLLPTLSSLAFLPTVSIATKRRFYMEAMIYLFTMFFVAVSGGLRRKTPTERVITTVLGQVLGKRDLEEKESGSWGAVGLVTRKRRFLESVFLSGPQFLHDCPEFEGVG